MLRLPLFPLPVVLFPGASLPLHIFEPRYRRMVARCLEFDRRFGLVYHDPDRAGPFSTDSGGVGCVAFIERFQLLPDGRSLIRVQGEERFRILDGVESGEPFLEAVVEPFTDPPPSDPEGLPARRRDSAALFLRLLERVGREGNPVEALDPDRELSFRLARRVGVDPEWQQALLESTDEGERLDLLDRLFRAAIRSTSGQE